jgi:hypothetical protein
MTDRIAQQVASAALDVASDAAAIAVHAAGVAAAVGGVGGKWTSASGSPAFSFDGVLEGVGRTRLSAATAPAARLTTAAVDSFPTLAAELRLAAHRVAGAATSLRYAASIADDSGPVGAIVVTFGLGSLVRPPALQRADNVLETAASISARNIRNATSAARVRPLSMLPGHLGGNFDFESDYSRGRAEYLFTLTSQLSSDLVAEIGPSLAILVLSGLRVGADPQQLGMVVNDAAAMRAIRPTPAQANDPASPELNDFLHASYNLGMVYRDRIAADPSWIATLNVAQFTLPDLAHATFYAHTTPATLSPLALPVFPDIIDGATGEVQRDWRNDAFMWTAMTPNLWGQLSHAVDPASPLVWPPPSPTSAQQGTLGDCWLVASLAAVAATDPLFMLDLVTDNFDGTFTVHLVSSERYPGSGQPGDPADVTVDTQLLRSPTGPLGVSTAQGTWAAVVERAFAEHAGGYPEIEGGLEWDAMATLGFTNRTDSSSWAPPAPTNADDTGSTFSFAEIDRALSRGDLVTTNVYTTPYGDTPEDFERLAAEGLPAMHAYTVLDTFEQNGTQYVVVRNPWGAAEFEHAAWTDGTSDGIFTLDWGTYQTYFNQVVLSPA